jgi:uncharacterized protein (TIGR03435 family)
MQRLALFLSICGGMAAQTPDPAQKIEFEVASIRPAKQDDHHSTHFDGELVRVHNLTLKSLVAQAYNVDLRQILGGPSWVDSDSYDISAKIPAEYVSGRRSQERLMMQSLLADRFHLATHRAPMEISGYALVVAKKGPKMERSTKDGGADSSINANDGDMHAENVTMKDFADILSRTLEVGKLVADHTGLKDRYNFELKWDTTNPLAASADAASSDRPSIFTALQDRLGLKVEPARISVESIVIDHAEKPGEN